MENGRVGMGLEISQEKKKICVVDYFTNGRERERERERIEIGLRTVEFI